MVQQADSIQTDAALEAESQQQVLRQHSSQLTPKEVLSWLPKNATPAQQDSMIRAHIISIFEYIMCKNKIGAAGSGFLNINAVIV